jgi:MoxR-like ATPase
VRIQNLVAAAAVLAGRQRALREDLWPIVLAVPAASGQQRARQCLEDELSCSDSPSLWSLAEEAAAAPKVRARRLLAEGKRLLEMVADPEREMRIEGLLREIDASLLPTHWGQELEQVRARLVEELA